MPKKTKKPADGGSGVDLLDKDEIKSSNEPPKKYKVIFHNDDFTPMDFVAAILIAVFNMPPTAAWEITLDIHEKGRGIAEAGLSKEIAETKTEKVIATARSLGHPLLATFEPE